MGFAILIVVEIGILIILCSQFAYALAILIIGKIQIEYYEWGIFKEPENWFQKIVNFILRLLVGIGPYIYYKTANRSWIVSKLLYSLFLLCLIISGIICYYILSRLGNLITG
ncbi:hypothetical protein [Bacillus sp. SJS]|uniref:hypothetical protein n=1 Tax=Bacillus sp. SJS TaxID=1423321 RepID=UPI0004DD8B74|nr:hypothetical protein [Bacillus sp. SJS]KZZ85084.1 hypothetical protein AS29_008530 [Bacillus sp. SJS]